MVVSECTETEDLVTPLLLMAVDDTNEAPWITMPEFQSLLIALLAGILRLHNRRRRRGWHISTELTVTMPRPEERGTLTLGPDLFVLEADEEMRSSWDVRAEGQPPRLVLEVVTDKSVERDTSQKPGYYGAMGVEEYVVFWPYRPDSGPKLFGHHRDADGRWVPWITDEQGVLWCEALGGLGLRPAEAPWLRVIDQQGNLLPAPEEEADRADQEAQRAERAEAEVARLRALLEGKES